MLAFSPDKLLVTTLLLGLVPMSGRAETHVSAVGAVTSALSDDLVRVLQCRFEDEKTDDEEGWDVNYDGWPDRWTRVYDDEHPSYVQMRIEPIDDSPEIPGRCFVIRPDGASAAATSPPIHVMPKFSYKLRLRLKVSDAEHGKARIGIAFHNAQDEVRQLELTAPLKSDGEWREVELGDFQPEDPQVDRLYVQIFYDRGERGDLKAEVSVADIRLYRLPSIKIETGSPYNVYTDPSDVKVTCNLSGIFERDPEIRFQLLDAANRLIVNGGELRLDGEIIHESRTRASEIVDGYGSDKSSYEGSMEWRPPIKDYGFYRVRVGMFSGTTGEPVGERRSITLAVVRPGLDTSESGEFGWTLPRADRPLSFPVLQELLPRVGVRLVKLPVWFPVGDEERGEELSRFAEQLAARGIETVGILQDPSLRISDPLSDATPPNIEGLLAVDPSFWTPMIDHVITRLSLRIRWWQLGADGDTSFVGYNKLVDHINAISTQMFRFGQDVRIGLGWRWDYPVNWKKPLSWDFEQMSGREQLDANGLAAALKSAPPSTAQRWVLVTPPEFTSETPEGVDPEDTKDPRVQAALVRSHQRRVRDFVEQILVAKRNGIEGIFVANPFSGSADIADAQTGVMNADGTAGELLLPWRTCARLLGSAEYIGSIQLPHDSSNWLFRRPDGQVVMVLWNLAAEADDANAAPLEENLYLGERIRVVSIWGNEEEVELRNDRQVIRVGRMPRFVIGLNESIARWRVAAQFQSPTFSSVFGVRQPNAIEIKNTFPQGVGGMVGLFVSDKSSLNAAHGSLSADEWNIEIDDPRLSLPAGSSVTVPFTVQLDDASFGNQKVRLDFAITADQDYRFSVWRELQVGLGDVSLEVKTYIGQDGRLVVEQQMRKLSGPPADFKCLLYSPERRRKRNQVFQLGPDLDKKRYTFLNTEGLIGQELRLRIEEIDGSRVLIHRFIVDPQPLEASDPDAPASVARSGSA